MTQEVDNTWTEDPEHGIPFINKLDVMTKFADGRRNLAIIVSSPIDESTYSQNRLLNKIQNYIHYLGSEQYVEEFGRPSPELVNLVVRIDCRSSPTIFELLEKCTDWVASGGATLVVEQV